MSGLKYPHLFEPIQLGDVIYKNRIFAAPTGYQNVNGDGFLPSEAPYYYERRAMGGCASVSTFEVTVDEERGRGGKGQMCAETPFVTNNYGRVAAAISSYGAVPTMEIQHCGMFANRLLGAFGATPTGPAWGPVEMEKDGRTIQAATEEDIQRMIDKFVSAAMMAQRMGFRAVLVHAGHGWGIHQFLSPITNTRTDKWGGAPIENRARLLLAVIDGIHAACGKGFPVEVRISGSECYDGGFGIETGIEIAQAIDGHADLIHVSAGNHEVDEVFCVTHPSNFMPDGCNVQYAAEIKKHVKTPVATVGALSDPALMEEIIASGQADVVELAREMMAEPDFVNKIRAGKDDDARRCLRCLSCFSSELTNGEPYCAINPTSGRELDTKYEGLAPVAKKKVLVVGGGVGGMQAALSCAERGHEVVLCEKEDRLGGVLNCEEDVDFKKLTAFYLAQQADKVKRAGVDIRLGTEVTADVANEIAPDVIVVSTGAVEVTPNIKGVEKALGAIDAYGRMDEIGERVIIIGSGLVAVEQALYLRGLGKDVQVLIRGDHMKDGGNFLYMPAIRREVKYRELKVAYKTSVDEITDTGVKATCEGEPVDYEADTVIFATGMAPVRKPIEDLHACAPEFYIIGDCAAVRDMNAAVTEGYMAARNLGRF